MKLHGIDDGEPEPSALTLADIAGHTKNSDSDKQDWDPTATMEKILKRCCNLDEMKAKGVLAIDFRAFLGVGAPQVDSISYDGDTPVWTRFDPVMYFAEKCIHTPRGFLADVEEALRSISPEGVDYSKYPIRIVHLPESRKRGVRQLRVSDLGTLISVEGMVRRVTKIQPKLVTAVYRCEYCGVFIDVEQDGLSENAPKSCVNGECKSRSFKFMQTRSKYVDSQILTLQESQEGLKGGEVSQSIPVELVMEDIVGLVNPGDRITINGIVRGRHQKIQGEKSTLMTLHLEGISIEISEKEFDEVEITDQDREEIVALSQDPELVQKLIRSFAPSIQGNEEIKLAILLQMFGGVQKIMPDGTAIRGDSHVLLVSDPSTGKSQIMHSAYLLALRAVKASGQASTGAGLTAAAVRDELTGQWALEGGALPRADRGFAIIDEMDKMNSEDRSSIHECMEQQSFTVSKAGISATMRTRCPILGAANPEDSRFTVDEGKELIEQVDMPASLLSRFDLVFIYRDVPNRINDTKLAEFIGNRQMSAGIMERKKRGLSVPEGLELQSLEGPVPTEMIRKYIAHAKQTCFPIITPEAIKHFTTFYADLRAKGGPNAPVTATARQLEGFYRLAESSARLRLSDTITVTDAENVTKLIMTCLMQVAYDSKTGTIDIDRWQGVSKKSRDIHAAIKEIVRALSAANNNGPARWDAVVSAVAQKTGATKDEVESKLEQMKGEIIQVRPRQLLRLID